MNLLSLVSHTRLAAPAVRARLESSTAFERLRALARVVGRLAAPEQEPVPVLVPVRRPRALAKVLAAAAAVALTAGAARADVEWGGGRHVSDFDWTVDGRLVEVSVRVDGAAAPLYIKPGAWDRRYLQAFRGRPYALVVRNTTGRRVGVLIAVDGLNVVNGERTRMRHDEPMYVLDPWETATIRGWRTSLSEVRRFVFVDEERSYAERTGQANGDLGWIRVHAFRETRPVAWRDWDRRFKNEARPFDRGDERGFEGEAPRAEGDAARERQPRDEAPAPSSPEGVRKQEAGRLHAAPESSNPGTGWGDRRHDPVNRTEFLAERAPADRITLRYEYASGLRALGIFPRRGERTWERERGELGFARPPIR